MRAVVAAGGGFLLAVLWFDLMFDVQVLRHRRLPRVPDDVLDSIARYYRRVTIEAFPMNRLVALAMVATLGGIAAELHSPGHAAADVASLVLAGVPVGLAGARTVRRAKRLGAQRDERAAQSRLARAVCRDHLVCAAGIAALLVVQLARVP
jgi:hypothetical protein